MKREKWPYLQISINDNEQEEIKKEIEDCCVAFIDILGFKEMVATNIDKVILALRYIEVFCDSFYKFPTKTTDRLNPTVPYPSVYDDDKVEFQDIEDDIELEMNKPTATMFSDSIVISQPINEYFDISEFVNLLSKIQYQLLLEGVLIRGGIAVGKLYHKNGYIFGDGIISAYELESKISKYPRIIISKDVIKRFDDIIMERFNSSYNQYIWIGKEKIYLPAVGYDYEYSPYINIDSDGIYYINYLKENLDSIKAVEFEFMDVSLRLLEDFYDDQYSMIIKYIANGLINSNSNTYEKYLWLKNHFNKAVKLCLNTYIGRFEDEIAEKQFFDEWKKLYIE